MFSKNEISWSVIYEVYGICNTCGLNNLGATFKAAQIGSDAPTTTEGHRLFATTRYCNYSLFELLMMGECFTRNM
jgi:hypothetical protein